MSMIDTPLMQDAKCDLSSFRELLSRLRGPLGKTTTVDKCGAAFVKGMERRKSRIYCPDWVGLSRWLRPLVATPVAERFLRKAAPELLPMLDAEVAALGRSTNARTEALETHSSAPAPPTPPAPKPLLANASTPTTEYEPTASTTLASSPCMSAAASTTSASVEPTPEPTS
jgi:hypothetical protein